MRKISRTVSSFLIAGAVISLAASQITCGTQQCDCASPGVELLIRDESGATLYPDSITYSIDGVMISGDQAKSRQSKFSLNSQPGNYHIWVKYGDQEWESEDIAVALGGPENCQVAQTVEVTVTFTEDSSSSRTAPIGGTCG